MSMKPREMPGPVSDSRRDYEGVIDYIKDQVGHGWEYFNDLVRVVLSERGCYYEFRDMPEEFSGAVGSDFRYEFIGTGKAREMLRAVRKMASEDTHVDTSELSLMVIYTWDGVLRREDTFIHHWTKDENEDFGPTVLGAYRPDVVPLFFKLKVDSDLAEPLLGRRKGVLFFVSNVGDQHLMVWIPHHGPGVTDLNAMTGDKIVH